MAQFVDSSASLGISIRMLASESASDACKGGRNGDWIEGLERYEPLPKLTTWSRSNQESKTLGLCSHLTSTDELCLGRRKFGVEGELNQSNGREHR